MMHDEKQVIIFDKIRCSLLGERYSLMSKASNSVMQTYCAENLSILCNKKCY